LQCELCGTATSGLRAVAIEGTVLRVCASCQRFGVTVVVPETRRSAGDPLIAERLVARARRQEPKDILVGLEGDDDLASDLGMRVRQAREVRGWKQAELAAKIQERASVVANLESGSLVPDDALLRKLERALGLKLKEKVGKVAAKKYGGPGSQSLGDLAGLESQ